MVGMILIVNTFVSQVNMKEQKIHLAVKTRCLCFLHQEQPGIPKLHFMITDIRSDIISQLNIGTVFKQENFISQYQIQVGEKLCGENFTDNGFVKDPYSCMTSNVSTQQTYCRSSHNTVSQRSVRLQQCPLR